MSINARLWAMQAENRGVHSAFKANCSTNNPNALPYARQTPSRQTSHAATAIVA